MLCKHVYPFATGLLLVTTIYSPPFAPVSFHCTMEKERSPTQIRAQQCILYIKKILNLPREIATEDISVGDDVFCIVLPRLTDMVVKITKAAKKGASYQLLTLHFTHNPQSRHVEQTKLYV